MREISSRLAVPVFVDVELIRVGEAAAISCGRESKNFIPEDSFEGLNVNSSPSRG